MVITIISIQVEVIIKSTGYCQPMLPSSELYEHDARHFYTIIIVCDKTIYFVVEILMLLFSK